MRNLLLLLFILGFTFSSNAQDSLLIDSLQMQLDRILSQDGAPGATLAIILPDDQKISLASGWEDKEEEDIMLPGSRMLAGSVGKTFFSALALKLIAERDISLDTLIAPWFEEETWFDSIPNAQTITLRMLMNHTSGIPRYVFQPDFLAALKANPMKRWQPAELLAFVLDKKPVHAAGQGWGYSDTNYIILGMIVEKWVNKSIYVEAKRRVLGPVGLFQTRPSYKRQLTGLTQGHVGDFNPFGLPKKVVSNGVYAINPQFEWTGGGYMSNVDDLARWIKAVHTRNVVPKSLYADFVQAADLKTGQAAEFGYGLGTFVWDTKFGTQYGHSGFFPGYITIVEYNPELNVSIAIQYNSDGSGGRNLHNNVLTIMEMVARNLK
ncbi:MAG: serine hydrolase domain-containing protein [Bacteroidota bacterium]